MTLPLMVSASLYILYLYEKKFYAEFFKRSENH